MPDVFKQQGIRPATDSVCIPDVVFSNAPEEPHFMPESAAAESGNTECSDSTDFLESDQTTSPAERPADNSFVADCMSHAEMEVYYREELADVKREAAERAYAEALRCKKAELTQCMAAVDQQLAEMQQLQSQYMEQYACELKYLAIEIAEKMILSKIEENDLILTKLVMQTVNSVKNTDWLSVELSEHLVSLVDSITQELSKPEYHGHASVTPTACADDTCRVSTAAGTVVATVSTQAQNLRKAFQAADQSEEFR